MGRARCPARASSTLSVPALVPATEVRPERRPGTRTGSGTRFRPAIRSGNSPGRQLRHRPRCWPSNDAGQHGFRNPTAGPNTGPAPGLASTPSNDASDPCLGTGTLADSGALSARQALSRSPAQCWPPRNDRASTHLRTNSRHADATSRCLLHPFPTRPTGRSRQLRNTPNGRTCRNCPPRNRNSAPWIPASRHQVGSGSNPNPHTPPSAVARRNCRPIGTAYPPSRNSLGASARSTTRTSPISP